MTKIKHFFFVFRFCCLFVRLLSIWIFCSSLSDYEISFLQISQLVLFSILRSYALYYSYRCVVAIDFWMVQTTKVTPSSSFTQVRSREIIYADLCVCSWFMAPSQHDGHTRRREKYKNLKKKLCTTKRREKYKSNRQPGKNRS